MYKRIFVIMLLLLSTTLSSNNIAYAKDIHDNSIVNETEQILVKYKEILESVGLTGEYNRIELYNMNSISQWYMYYNDSSYLILDINSGKIMEYGYETRQPYDGYLGSKLYYGGPLCYSVEKNGQYLEIRENKTYSTIPTIKGVRFLNNEDKISLSNENNQLLNYTPSGIVGQKNVASYYSYIQRPAFGNNTNGTCSAVATAVVLTYLDRYRAAAYVPSSNYRSPDLEGEKYNADKYANAERLHQLLVSSGMGTMSYADRIRSSVANYKNKYLSNTTLSVDWQLFKSNPTYITNQIDKNIPGMITTTVFTSGYNFHTMAVYGYQKLSDGTYHYLVHTGWYSDVSNSTVGYRMGFVYIPSHYETYMYKFNV